jgi:hypothetical protein
MIHAMEQPCRLSSLFNRHNVKLSFAADSLQEQQTEMTELNQKTNVTEMIR